MSQIKIFYLFLAIISIRHGSEIVVPVQTKIEIHPGLEKAKIEKVSLKVSESISDKYSDKNVNSDIDIPNLPNVKIEISQNAKEAQSDISEATRQIKKVSLENSESMGNKYNDENLNDPVEKVSLKLSNSIVNEYNDANLNENLNDPVEKVS